MPRGGMGKRYPDDFKQSAIEMVLNSGESTIQIAKNLNISPKTLYGWVGRYKQEHGLIDDKKEDTQEKSIEDELKRLKKENARLKMECEILKKATAYFAKETM